MQAGKGPGGTVAAPVFSVRASVFPIAATVFSISRLVFYGYPTCFRNSFPVPARAAGPLSGTGVTQKTPSEFSIRGRPITFDQPCRNFGK